MVHVDNSLARISDELKNMKSGPDMDCSLLEKLEEQLSGLKLELFDVSQSIIALTEDTTVQTDKEKGKPKAYLMHAFTSGGC